MQSSPPVTDISSCWYLSGSSDSMTTQCQPVSHTVPSEFHWNRVSNSVVRGVKQKRPWVSTTVGQTDDPPCKIHINEEKVVKEFGYLSIGNSVASHDKRSYAIPEVNTEDMWKHYYELEQKLNTYTDIEVDEGVSVDADVEQDKGDASVPSLIISPTIKDTLKDLKELPQIFVPKPCTEVVLWAPTGVDFIKEAAQTDSLLGVKDPAPQSEKAKLNVSDCMKASRKKKTATRSASVGSAGSACSSGFLLNVPEVRPLTPPPNTRTLAVSDDISVCFIDEAEKQSAQSGDIEMDL